MKKILCALLTLCVSLSICIPVFAKTDMETVFDSSEEIRQAENLIYEYLYSLLEIEFGKDFAKEDVKYSNNIKYYYGTGILSDNEINEDNVVDRVENSPYEYEIYFEYKNAYQKIILSKIQEITEEQKSFFTEEELEERNKRIGELVIGGMVNSKEKHTFEYFKEEVERFLEHSKESYSKVYIISDFPGDIGAVAMLVSEDSEIRFKVLDGKIDNKQIDYKNTDDTLYTLAELKEITANSELPELHNGEILLKGDTEQRTLNKTAVIIAAVSAGAVIIAASAVIFVCIKKKKASAETDN